MRFVGLLLDLPIAVEHESSEHIVEELLFLGRQQGLSSYDASYLNLAMREGIPLATRDDRLRAASKKCGVTLI